MRKTLYDKYEQKKIGMLTPSSNTVLEPICSSMVYGHEKEITMHYGRFKVTEISLKKNALSQFSENPMIDAAKLLADADVDIIAWNGTSGGWLGFDEDKKLCNNIEQVTGIKATTSMLSQIEAFKANNVKKIHLVTPYIHEINELIIKEYEKNGIETVNSACLEQSVNRSFSLVPREKINSMIEKVCKDPADGISVVCTNFPAVWQADEVEAKYHIPVYDTINTVVWNSMRMIGMDPSFIKGWGSIFQAS